ncbi:MAG: hypothetical protein H3C36_11105 [Chitinophagaceae bacterium]|nr:hypothetical protein [Chitinophagaceae bacterium]MCZ2395217.1 hypothetical protein [Chitinophagales bacterium]
MKKLLLVLAMTFMTGLVFSQKSPGKLTPMSGITLTKDQRAKINEVNKNVVKQIEAIKADSNLSKREKFEKTREVREGQEESIKKLLTPEQYAKRQENIEKIKTQKEN